MPLARILWSGTVRLCSPIVVVLRSRTWLPRCRSDSYPSECSSRMNSRPLICGSRDVIQFQFRNNEYINLGGTRAGVKMQCDSFLDIGVKFVHRSRLRENVLADAAGAPKVTIVVDFHLYEHFNFSLPPCYRVQTAFANFAIQSAAWFFHAAIICSSPSRYVG